MQVVTVLDGMKYVKYTFFLNNLQRGNLGLGHTSKTVPTPTLIPKADGMIQCATGEGHTLFLGRDKRLYGCGWTLNGQITSKTTLETHHPHVIPMDYTIPEDEHIHKIVCGYRHSVFLTSKGVIYLADKKLQGHTGFVKYIQSEYIVDVDATMHSTIMLSRFGHIQIFGEQSVPPFITTLQQKNAIHFKGISIGRTHVLLLTDKNTILGFGKDFVTDELNVIVKDAQTQLAEIRSHVFDGYPVQISAGRNFSLVLTNTNKLYSFGATSYHQLGRVNYTEKLIDQVDFSRAQIPLGMKIVQIVAGCDSATVVMSHLGSVEQFVTNLYNLVYKKPSFLDVVFIE
jgi:hypothetical protein